VFQEETAKPGVEVAGGLIASQLWSSWSWETISKAFEKSKMAMSTCLPLSKEFRRSFVVVIAGGSQLSILI